MYLIGIGSIVVASGPASAPWLASLPRIAESPASSFVELASSGLAVGAASSCAPTAEELAEHAYALAAKRRSAVDLICVSPKGAGKSPDVATSRADGLQ